MALIWSFAPGSGDTQSVLKNEYNFTSISSGYSPSTAVQYTYTGSDPRYSMRFTDNSSTLFEVPNYVNNLIEPKGWVAFAFIRDGLDTSSTVTLINMSTTNNFNEFWTNGINFAAKSVRLLVASAGKPYLPTQIATFANWNYVTFYWDCNSTGNNIWSTKLYINGILHKEETQATTRTFVSGRLLLGGFGSYGNPYYLSGVALGNEYDDVDYWAKDPIYITRISPAQDGTGTTGFGTVVGGSGGAHGAVEDPYNDASYVQDLTPTVNNKLVVGINDGATKLDIGDYLKTTPDHIYGITSHVVAEGSSVTGVPEVYEDPTAATTLSTGNDMVFTGGPNPVYGASTTRSVSESTAVPIAQGNGTTTIWTTGGNASWPATHPKLNIVPGSIKINWVSSAVQKYMYDDGTGGFIAGGDGNPSGSSINYTTGALVVDTTGDISDNLINITVDYAEAWDESDNPGFGFRLTVV